MPYYERNQGATGVLCDRCGFGKHYRPEREGDVEAAKLTDLVDGPVAWTWDPQGSWCWAPLFSASPTPCDNCGANVNTQVPLHIILHELKELAR